MLLNISYALLRFRLRQNGYDFWDISPIGFAEEARMTVHSSLGHG